MEFIPETRHEKTEESAQKSHKMIQSY